MEWIGRPEPPAQPQQEAGPSHVKLIAQELAKARTAIAMLLWQLRNRPDLRNRYAELLKISVFASEFINSIREIKEPPSEEEIKNEIINDRIILEGEKIGILALLNYIRDCLANAMTHTSSLDEESTLKGYLEEHLQNFIQLLNELIKSHKNPN